MSRRRRLGILALAALAGLLLAYLAIGWCRPQWLLEAEFARQRWQAGASESSLVAAGHRWSLLGVEARARPAADAPLTVLIHGFTGSKENWLPILPALAAHGEIVAPDLPGWGGSQRQPDADYGFVAQAERLADFLRQLGAEQRPVWLVGHSMGGGIVALLAARHPQLVDRLVLLDAAGSVFDENEFARLVLAGGHPFEVTDRASLHRQLALVFDDVPWLPWPFDRAVVERRRLDGDFERQVLDRIGRSDEALRPSVEAQAIIAPTLLLWCRNDRIIDPSAARYYAEAIPDTRQVLLDDCNHMPMVEQPDATVAALRAFFIERS